MIGRTHHLVIDCAHPALLAESYSALLGLPVTYRSEDWVLIAENGTTSGVPFRLASDHEPPQWPDPRYPQQCHLDVMVDDIAVAADRVLTLGARKPSHDRVCSPIRPAIRSVW